MSDERLRDGSRTEQSESEHDLLLRMDLATEILEGLDELGLDTRAQVEALLAELERRLGDAT